MASEPPTKCFASSSLPSRPASENLEPLIHSSVASSTDSKTISRQSAEETARVGSSGAWMGRAPGLSWRAKNSLKLANEEG